MEGVLFQLFLSVDENRKIRGFVKIDLLCGINKTSNTEYLCVCVVYRKRVHKHNAVHSVVVNSLVKRKEGSLNPRELRKRAIEKEETTTKTTRNKSILKCVAHHSN